MADVRIINMEQRLVFTPEGTPGEGYRLTFTVGEKGPFIIDISIEGYSAAKGRAAVEEKAREIADTLGI